MVSSTLDSKDCLLYGPVKNYFFFFDKIQKYIKAKTENFPNVFDDKIVGLKDSLELEYISLVNGNNSKIVKKWKRYKSEKFINLYNEEIGDEILSNLKKIGDKLQIKIKVNEKIKEFVFWEFTVSKNYVEYSNSYFSFQKECYLDYFPKEVHSKNYLLQHISFQMLITKISLDNCNVNNNIEGENIKSSIIKTPFPSMLSFDMKNYQKPPVFKFTDFNLSIKQSQNFEVKERSQEETKYYHKPLIFFSETTKEVSKIQFDVFVPDKKLDKGQKGTEMVSIEISKDKKLIRKVEDNLSFSLVELHDEKNCIKVFLGRPTKSIKNPIKAKDSLSIEFMNLEAYIITLTKIFVNAKEKIKSGFTYTTFTIKKDEKERNLYDVIKRFGLVSITLNGEKGMIGTYGFYTSESEIYNCIYSDKLISIFPFEENKNVEQEKLEPTSLEKKRNYCCH